MVRPAVARGATALRDFGGDFQRRIMSEEKPPPALGALEARLKEARARRDAAKARAGAGAKISGLGFAARASVDIVAALAIGVGIGLALDWWLGTKPWLMVLFFVLGAAAGIANVFRLVRGQGGAVGYRPPAPKPGNETDEDG